MKSLESGCTQLLVQHNNLQDCVLNSGDTNVAQLVVNLGCPGLDVVACDSLSLGNRTEKREQIALTSNRRNCGSGSEDTFMSHEVQSMDVHLDVTSLGELMVNGQNFLDHHWNCDDTNVGKLLLNSSNPRLHIVSGDTSGVSYASKEGSHGASISIFAHVDSCVALVLIMLSRLRFREEVLGSSLDH